MNFYFFNNNLIENEFYIVHTANCVCLSSEFNRTYISYEPNSIEALKTAKRKYPLKKFKKCSLCYKK